MAEPREAAVISPITPEMMGQALDQIDTNCDDGGCIHMKAAEANHDRILAIVRDEVAEYARRGFDTNVGCFFLGLHVGYRLAQLAAEPISEDKVN